MSKDEIRDWLDKIGKDRFWLADKCGTTKHTVDSWFSTRGFPKPALKIIDKLMNETDDVGADVSLVQFTVDEYERIERARILACYLTRREFYRDAIIEKTTEILKSNQVPPLHALPRVAEEPTPYRTKRTDPDNLDDIRQQMDDDNHTN